MDGCFASRVGLFPGGLMEEEAGQGTGWCLQRYIQVEHVTEAEQEGSRWMMRLQV